MDLLQQFQLYIKTEKLFWQGDKLLIAVSGGVDSVVMCDLCSKAGFNFAIAHCNFGLRGEESEGDELFVADLAAKYGVQLFIRTFQTRGYAADKKLSIQVAARNLRYEWFQSLLGQSVDKSINYILTAHHANDNIETLLINFFKGTGLGGLRGIQPKSGLKGEIIRPLLFAKKDDLLNYAKGNSLAYREDSSNTSDEYTRNYFRHNVIPAIRKIYPKVEDQLLDNLNRLNDSYLFYRQSIEVLRKKIIIEKKGEFHLPVLKLLKTPGLKTFLYEIGKEFGFTVNQTDEIIKLLKSESGKYIDSPSHRILKNRDWLIISRHGEPVQSYFLIEETDTEIKLADGRLKIEKVPANVEIQ